MHGNASPSTHNTMIDPPLRITVLGIGQMGGLLAKRLRDAGHAVHAWNRTFENAQPLELSGIVVHRDAKLAVGSADVVISALADGAAVAAVLFEQDVARAMPQRALFVDMASIQPSEARDHAARLGELGIAHLDAPVSGGTVGAQAGMLAIMVGGTAADFARAQPVLSVLGRATLVGPSGAGQLAKLANQMIVGATIGVVAEALLFAAKGGADMAKVREAISGGFADSRILQLHGQRMVERDFAQRGSMNVQLKDMRNVLATAAEIDFDAPLTTVVETLYSQAIDHGLGRLDHSGLFVELASRNDMR